MPNNNEIIKLENGRVEFAFNCVNEAIKLENSNELKKLFKELKEKQKDKDKQKELDKQEKEKKINEIMKKLNLENYKLYDLSIVIEKFKISEYKSYCKKLPSMVLTNGLGQTLAFMNAKKGSYYLIYLQLENYIKKFTNYLNDTRLLNFVISTDSYKYRHITNEAFSFMNWLKRFSEGMIEGDDNEQENE